jgi:aspartate carbamoyltransferase catalytic subunit
MMPRDIYEDLAARGITQYEMTGLDGVVNQSDVLYVTRVQKVRVFIGQ